MRVLFDYGLDHQSHRDLTEFSMSRNRHRGALLAKNGADEEKEVWNALRREAKTVDSILVSYFKSMLFLLLILPRPTITRRGTEC